jgi:hypothetical protein
VRIDRRYRFLSWKRKNLRLKKKSFLFFVLLFAFLSIRLLKACSFLFFFVLESSSLISFEWSSVFLNSEKYEIVREEKIKFLDEKIVIKNNVLNFCKTNNSSFSSLNKSCVEIVEIEKKKEEKRNRFCLEFFVIDFVLNDFHVDRIKSLWNVVSIIEKIWKYQKVVFKKKKKEKMTFEAFNQYRESRSISNESDIKLTHDNLKKKELSKSLSHQKKTNSIAKKLKQIRSSTTVSSLQVLQMLLCWLIIMLAFETSETFFFDEYNITKFFDRYADLCLNYDLEKREQIRRFLRYCDLINEQYVKVVINANVFEWKDLCKILYKDYKNKYLNQQLHFLKYLEIFKNKVRTFLKEISQYCRQYTIISEKLIKSKKLQRTLRNAWFLQRLFEKFSEKLAIRCFLNENDENKMRFENLMKQTLQLIKSRNAIIKARKIDYKTKRTTTLMKKMKSIMRKNVNKHFINLLKTMKFKDEESISNVDVKLDDLTEVMRKTTMNVDNLINFVFFSSERNNFESSQDYQSYMFSRYSSSNQSFMFSLRSFSLFLQNMFSQNMSFSIMSLLNNEALRLSFIKCIYC